MINFREVNVSGRDVAEHVSRDVFTAIGKAQPGRPQLVLGSQHAQALDHNALKVWLLPQKTTDQMTVASSDVADCLKRPLAWAGGCAQTGPNKSSLEGSRAT